MGMFSRVRRWVKSVTRRVTAEPTFRLRRWDASNTDRLNEGHWQPVTGGTINADLAGRLETLRTRCEYELSNNPIAAGVVETHVCNVVGEHGPRLQVLSTRDIPRANGRPGKRDETAERIEQAWNAWWAMPDRARQLSGADLLQLWVRTLWPAGEFLTQIVTDRARPGPVKMSLLNLSTRRLVDPLRGAIPRVHMGVEYDEVGQPVAYHIDRDPAAMVSGAGLDIRRIDAAYIIHEFEPLEPGQLRGVPLLASALQPIADLRDYDAQVLDAARQAADFGVILHASGPDVPFTATDASVEVERRHIVTAPPGYTPFQMSPQQPSTQYLDHRHERLREIGRPVNMPLMMVTLDSSDHNYSSARFDGQLYRDGIRKLQGRIARRVLDRLVDLVAREAGIIGAERPADLRYAWVWPRTPHVDPLKEAKAQTERLNSGTSTLAIECAANGDDWEEIVEQRQRERERLIEAGLASEPANPDATADDEESDDEQDDNEATPNKPAGANGRMRAYV